MDAANKFAVIPRPTKLAEGSAFRYRRRGKADSSSAQGGLLGMTSFDDARLAEVGARRDGNRGPRRTPILRVLG
jgi:hypothetical protein